MLNWLKNIWKNRKSAESLQGKVTPEAISGAYENRYREIESLRKYDRGEKTIPTANLKKLVRSL